MSYSKHGLEEMRLARKKLAEGQSVRSLSKEMGIPYATLHGWKKALGSLSGELPPERDPPKTSPRSSALGVPLRADPSAWARYGFEHPLEGRYDKDQSKRIFELVACGLTFGDAIEGAGGRSSEEDILRSKWNNREEPESSYFAALKICQAWVLGRSVMRVFEGFAGWQGAKALLAALRPYLWGDKKENEYVDGFDLGIDQTTLDEICLDQILRRRGSKLSKEYPVEILPLEATGMQDNEDEEGGSKISTPPSIH